MDFQVEKRSESDEEFLKDAMETLKTADKPSHSRAPYTLQEDHLIMKWILAKTGRYMEVGGRDLWKDAEANQITGVNRTWQSLKERYIKRIIPYIDEFVPDVTVRNEIKAFMQKRRKEKIRSRAIVEKNITLEEELGTGNQTKRKKDAKPTQDVRQTRSKTKATKSKKT